MDPDTLKNATAPFFRTKGVGKGTGLGLSMVQGLMAQSSGKLVLHSVESAGTTAELWLPIVLATGYWELPPGARADLLSLSKPFGERQLEDITKRAMSGDTRPPKR
jgi:hypothetical protein